MKSICYKFCFFIIATAVVFATGCQSAMDNFVEIRLKKEAEEMNKKGATIIGDGIRLDSVSTTGKAIRFSYTMLNVNKEDVNAPVFYKNVKTELIKSAKTNKDMDFYKKNKVTISYAYHYKNGTPLSTIIIKPEDYTGSKN